MRREVEGSLFLVDPSFIEIRNGFSMLEKHFYRFENFARETGRDWREILNKNRPTISLYPLFIWGFDPGRFSTRVKGRVELDSLHTRFLC